MSIKAKKIAAGSGLVVILLVVFLAGRWTGGAPSHDHEGAEGDEVAETAAANAEEIWTCSMHPQVRQPDPGQCPICGMDLIPASGDDDPADEGELPRLRVSERSAALMNIQTWPVERRVVEREVRLLGRVNYDETRRRTVTAWIPGRLDRLFVDIEGASIQRGDPIAEIYSPALISAQEELLQALRTAREREQENGPMVRAARERLRLFGLNDEQIREIEERGTVQDHLVINSPLDGVIIDRIAVEGSYVEAGTPIAALAGLDQVFVDLEAYERDLPWLVEGQTAKFTFEGLANRSFEGQVAQINPFVDEQRRTARVRVLVENPNGTLKPGMFARGMVLSRLGEAGGAEEWREETPLVIPATAALITGRRAVVYVKIPDTDRPTFELRQVELGPRAGEYYVVREGVNAGEQVVTNGNFKIDSELQLRGRPSMMAPPDEVRELPPGIGHDHPALAVDQNEIPLEAREGAASLVRAYLALSEALAGDDFSAARQAVIDLHEYTAALDALDLSGSVARAWGALSAQLHRPAHAMAEARDLDGVREHLEPLTDQVELVVRSLAAGDVYPVFRATCPMAFDDQGADWLQMTEEIANPYFGASMLRCGEVRYQVALDTVEERATVDSEKIREEPVAVTRPEAVPEEFRFEIDRLAEHYLSFAERLAADEFAPAQTVAEEMVVALEDINDALLDEEDRHAWHRLSEQIEETLEQAIEAEDIERAREMLQPLTDALEAAALSYGSEDIDPLYRAYCPMAFNNSGGTWLQRDQTVNNPYFGASMLRCGEILGELGERGE